MLNNNLEKNYLGSNVCYCTSKFEYQIVGNWYKDTDKFNTATEKLFLTFP